MTTNKISNNQINKEAFRVRIGINKGMLTCWWYSNLEKSFNLHFLRNEMCTLYFSVSFVRIESFLLICFSGISQITRRIIRRETIFKCSLFEESRRELMFLKPQYIFIYIIFFLSFLVKNLLHEWHNTISECLCTHIRTKIYFALSYVLLTSLEGLKVSTDFFLNTGAERGLLLG